MLLLCLCGAVTSASCPVALQLMPGHGRIPSICHGCVMLAHRLIMGMPQVPRSTDAFQRLVQAYQALLATTT